MPARVFRLVQKPLGMPAKDTKPLRFIVINKRDKDEFDFYKTFDELKAKFGDTLIPFSWPLSAEIDEDLKEAIAMADDALMEKYFDGEDFLTRRSRAVWSKGILRGRYRTGVLFGVPAWTGNRRSSGSSSDLCSDAAAARSVCRLQ